MERLGTDLPKDEFTSNVYSLNIFDSNNKKELADLIQKNNSPEVIEYTFQNGKKVYLIKDKDTDSYHVVNEETYEEYEKTKDSELLKGSEEITSEGLVNSLISESSSDKSNPLQNYLQEEEKDNSTEQEAVEESLYGDFVADIELLSQAYESVLGMSLGINPCLAALEYTSPSFPGTSLNGNEYSSAKISKPEYNSAISAAITNARNIAGNIELKIKELSDTVDNQIEVFKLTQREAAEILDFFLMMIASEKLQEYIDANDTNALIENIDILPQEYIQYLVGQMDQEQYDEFIEGIKEYHTREIKDLDYLRGINTEVLNTVNAFPLVDYHTGFAEMLLDPNKMFDANVGIKLETDMNLIISNLYKTNPELADEYARIYNEFTDQGVMTRKSYISFLNNIISITPALAELEITNYEELIQMKRQVDARQIQIENGLNENYNKRESAEYDYLYFFKGYHEYEMPKAEGVGTLGLDLSYPNKKGSGNNPIYDYEKYHAIHPEVNEIDYILSVKRLNAGNRFEIKGLKEITNAELEIIKKDLNDLVETAEYDENFLKTYSYFYQKDPEQVGKYIKAVQYQINDIKGQIEANKFLKLLGEKNGKGDIFDFIRNELGIVTEGVLDGADTFFDGLGYAVESIFTIASGNENRALSVDEYKKRYILEALLSEKDKEQLGLIEKNEQGIYVTATPYQIIDYTKEYVGFFKSNQYEISQGIGNMLPSMLLSSINPLAGSIALGISSGGNSYHNAMVGGSSIARSVLYGIASGCTEAITEKFLGGLPFLSDVKVVDFKTYRKAVLKEGMEEFYQDFIDMYFESTILGKPFEVPQTGEEWWQAIKNRAKTFTYGAITAGVMQSPTLIALIKAHMVSSIDESLDLGLPSYAKNTQISDGLAHTMNILEKYDISSTEQAEAIARVKKFHPEYSNMSDMEIMQIAGNQVILQSVYAKAMGNKSQDTVKLLASIKENFNEVKDIFKEVFINYYGEENRGKIEAAFDNAYFLPYSTSTSINAILSKANQTNAKALFNSFSNTSEVELKYGDLFDFSGDYKDSALYKYFKAKNLFNYSLSEQEKFRNYSYKDDLVDFLKRIRPDLDITKSNVVDLIEGNTFSEINQLEEAYQRTIHEQSKYMSQYEEQKAEIDRITRERDAATKEARENRIEKSKWFTEKYGNAKDGLYVKWDLHKDIEAFLPENQALLETDGFQADEVRKKINHYFQGMYGKDMSEVDPSLWPDPEDVSKLVKIKHESEQESNYLFYEKAYAETLKELRDLGWTEDSVELDILDSAYNQNAAAFVSPQINQNGELKPVVVINFSDDNLGTVDHHTVHELNHLVELGIKDDHYLCGWDVIGMESSDDTTSPKSRAYEQLNETINEKIAQEISKSMVDNGIFVFGTQDNTVYKGGTTYERRNPLINDFYQEYDKAIFKSRQQGNMQIIYDAVGEENFNELNNLINTFQQQYQSSFFEGIKKTNDFMKVIRGNTEGIDNLDEHLKMISERDRILENMRNFHNSK